jgi:hypothetical protein
VISADSLYLDAFLLPIPFPISSVDPAGNRAEGRIIEGMK